MGSTLFRDPQARSSALATLGTLQPRAFRSLNRVDPLDLVSNYYRVHIFNTCIEIVILAAMRIDNDRSICDAM